MGYDQADLNAADRQISHAEDNVAKQRLRIAHLEALGRPTAMARSLLVSFDAALINLQIHRAQIAAELERKDGAGG